MFGSLKKRLKDAISKVSKAIKEEKPEEPVPKEEITEEIKEPALEIEKEPTVEEKKPEIKEAPEEKQEPLPEPHEVAEEIPEPEIEKEIIEEPEPEAPEEIREPLPDAVEPEIKKEPKEPSVEEKKPEIKEEVTEIRKTLEEIREKVEKEPEEFIEGIKPEEKIEEPIALTLPKEIEKEEIKPVAPEAELKPEIKIKEKPKEEHDERMRAEGEEQTEAQPKGTQNRIDVRSTSVCLRQAARASIDFGVSPKEKKGFFSRIFRRAKEKTLSEADIEKILKELKLALLENDTAFEVTERICSDVKASLLNKTVKRGDVEKVIKESLRYAMLDVMSQEKINLEKSIEEKDGPYVIVFCGFNGTGKTTTIAKFANRFKKYKPIFAAGDTFRAASIEQLEEHARRLGIEVIKHTYGSDSAAVIFDAIKHAKAVGSKLVLADTAGRSHSNVNLMDELKKVCRVNNPDMNVLVLDSITGNDIYEQSRLFNEAVGIDAMILTKADVYEKGGAALSASHTIEKPILFLGTGQEYDDLKEFNPEEIVNNLLE